MERMSAAEMLEQVKLLPPDERRRLLDGLLALEEDGNGEVSKNRTERVVWPDARERLRKIFGERVLSENIVLAAREEEPY